MMLQRKILNVLIKTWH